MISTQYISRISLQRDKVESFDRYPFSLPAVRSLETLELHPKMTFFVGENGSGKSTLLEAIAVSMGFNPEGGTKNFNFGTRASHSELNEYLRIAKGVRRPKDGFFLRAESFFNVATGIENLDAEPSLGPPVINSYGGNSLHERSHGESFLALLMNRFGGKRSLPPRRAGSRVVSTTSTHCTCQTSRPGPRRIPVHHCYSLAHSDGVSGRVDL